MFGIVQITVTIMAMWLLNNLQCPSDLPASLCCTLESPAHNSTNDIKIKTDSILIITTGIVLSAVSYPSPSISAADTPGKDSQNNENKIVKDVLKSNGYMLFKCFNLGLLALFSCSNCLHPQGSVTQIGGIKITTWIIIVFFKIKCQLWHH